jgi:hypothetical protein
VSGGAERHANGTNAPVSGRNRGVMALELHPRRNRAHEDHGMRFQPGRGSKLTPCESLRPPQPPTCSSQCHGRAIIQNSIPQKKIGSLSRARPRTVSKVAAARSASRRRARTACASRMTPMTASSAPMRSHQRTRRARAGWVRARYPDLLAGTATELHTTRFRRRARILTAGSSEDSATWSFQV